MPKLYSVSIPSHSGGGSYEVVCKNESSVKELICSSMERSSVPRGTVIKKIGLTKNPITSVLGKNKDNKEKKEEIKEVSDSLRSRAKKKNKIVPEVNVEKVVEKEKEDIKKQKEKESLEYFHTDFGFSLRKDEIVTLKSKMDFSSCTIYVMNNDDIEVLCIGEDATVTLKRGDKFWLYLDHTTDKKYLKELQNHI